MAVGLAVLILAYLFTVLLVAMMMGWWLKAIQECLQARLILIIVLLVLVGSVNFIQLGLVASWLLIYDDQLLVVLR